MIIDTALDRLIEQMQLYKSQIKPVPINETEIILFVQQLVPAVETILDSGVWHLSTITCQQKKEKLVLLYHFWYRRGLTLRISLDMENAKINSITPLLPGAEFYEREVREMFGVEFVGLPNPTPFLLPDDWQGGYPMRKEETEQSGSKA